MNDNADIIFVLDASRETGMGHLRRCRVLMEELLERHAEVTVTGRIEGVDTGNELPANVRHVPMPAGLQETDEARFVRALIRRHERAVIIVDHYRATAEYQEAVLQLGIRWMLFDSFARLPLLADWVIHASPSATPERYEPLRRRNGTKFLLGPSYALVSREYREARARMSPRSALKRLLISFGGGDDRGATSHILRILSGMDVAGLEIDVVIGGLNPNIDDITAHCRTVNAHTLSIVNNPSGLAHLLSTSDCCINAGGVISYEAASLGVPSLIITIAENQEENAVGWETSGTGTYLGPLHKLDTGNFRTKLQHLLNDGHLLRMMSINGLSLVDGFGGERAATLLIEQ